MLPLMLLLWSERQRARRSVSPKIECAPMMWQLPLLLLLLVPLMVAALLYTATQKCPLDPLPGQPPPPLQIDPGTRSLELIIN